MRRRALFASLAALAVTPASAQAPDESEARNVETVRRFFAEVYNAHNREAARGIIADDFDPLWSTLPPGADGFIARLEVLFAQQVAAFRAYACIEEAIVADGPVVVWRGVMRG